MADIELVIKIPKEDYKAIKNMQAIGDLTIPYVFDAIRNGTVIPKGHGRIIDEDQIPGDGGWDFSDRLMSTPTIIEADRSDEE